MKKTVLMFLLTAALFACNNEAETDTTTDSTVIEQDNTVIRDTGMIRDTGLMNDTSQRRDSIRK
jgi:hypothetical protein